MPTTDPAQVRALVAALRPQDRRTVLAIRADPVWSGPEVLGGSPSIRVVPVQSPLAAREAMIRHEDRGDPGELLVLLTQCAAVDLGLDLRAQLMKGDVQSFDPFSSVLALFQARLLDPALAEERWLIEALISLAPATGWKDKAPLSGVLTMEDAWSTWQEARLGEPSVPTALLEVLALGERAEVRQALATLGDVRTHLVDRWAPATPTATGTIVDVLANNPGVSPTALGLVVGILWAATDDVALAQRQMLCRARMEPLLGRDRLAVADAVAWGRASTDRLVLLEDASGVVAEAERLLVEVDGRELSELADVLPSGFDSRLDRLGTFLGVGDLTGAVDALTSIERHGLASRRSRQVAACRAGVRLLRRLETRVAGPTGSVADRATSYRSDLAWVEQARRDLSSGSQSAPLAAAFGALGLRAAETQRAADESFAATLAEWSKSVPTADARIVPVEDLLETVVAPVAKDAPVLLVLCDGMGLSVSHQLVNDLRAEGWAPASPAGAEPWPVGVAVLPTVTAASRTSLFAGRVLAGAQPEERSGFAAHPALRHVSKPDRPPVLFHKAGLVAANGAALPDEIRAAVADPDQRVVGVVVNSVDDHLARGDQINFGWDLASLGPLGWLLAAASEAGRVVVLTADHGHVLDNGQSIARPQPTQGGERWRTAEQPPADGELEFSGPRVALGGGTVVMPFDERVRYGPPKHGYHGGATAEEVLVPVEVLTRRLPDGWIYHPVVTPSWWQDRPEPATPMVAPVAPVARRSKPEAPTLFDVARPAPTEGAPPAPGTTWVDSLLASPTFVAHRGNVRLPRPLADERLRGYLDALAANGNSITLAALAASSGEPAGTLRMTLSVVQRLLNIDGAEILAVRDDGSVVCNVELLVLQFELTLEDTRP